MANSGPVLSTIAIGATVVAAIASVLLVLASRLAERRRSRLLGIRRSVDNQHEAFLDDAPITRVEEDQLGRARFAQSVAAILLDISEATGFTIGLDGRWGSGKSSILNMVAQILSVRTEIVVVRFDPWEYSGDGRMLENLYRRIVSALDSSTMPMGSQEDSRIGLAALFVGYVNSVSGRFRIGGRQADPQALRRRIERALMRAGLRVVVLVDDLDRLGKTQVEEAFRVIQALSKFTNTSYVLAYDLTAIEEIIGRHGERSGAEFIQKIVQLPLKIPRTSRTLIENAIAGRLSSMRGLTRHGRSGDDRRFGMMQALLFRAIGDLRDVKRVLNVVQAKFSILGDEIDFVDVVTLSALQALYPTIYDYVSSNKETFCGPAFVAFDRLDRDSIRRDLERALKDQTTGAREVITDMLELLFPYFGAKQKNQTLLAGARDRYASERRIADPDHFDIALQDNPEAFAISHSELANITGASVSKEEARRSIQVLIDRNRVGAFLTRLQQDGDQVPADVAGNIVDALVDLGDYLPPDLGTFNLIDNTQRLLWVSRRLLESMDSRHRFSVFHEAVSSATQSLYTPAFLTYVFTTSPTQRDVVEDVTLFAKHEATALIDAVCEHIAYWCISGRLFERSAATVEGRDLFLLFRWWDWKGDVAVAAIKRALERDSWLAELLTNSVMYVTNPRQGDANLRSLVKMLGLSYLKSRLEELQGSDYMRSLNEISVAQFADLLDKLGRPLEDA